MRKIALTLALAALTAGTADAGPILNRLRARGSSCSSGQCSPSAAFPASSTVAATPVSGCVGGVCFPAASAPVAFPAACVGGSCAAPVRVRR